MNRPFVKMGIFALFFALFGCAPAPRTAVPPPFPGMEKVLLDKVRQNGEEIKGLRGMAKVRVTSGGRTFSANQVLFVQEPDHFRTEVLSPFGQPLLLAATNGEQLSVLIPGDARMYRGEASYANLQRFTRLPLQLDDLVALLLYSVPLLPAEKREVSTVPEGYLLTLVGIDDMRQELIFDPSLRLVRSAWFRNDALLLGADYGDFGGTGISFPRSLSLRVPSEESEASLLFSELDLNPGLDPARFTLEPPPGYAVEALPQP